ncbi:exodeoxyribonuclease VII large subunit [Neisseria sp. Ec49-e6-T10]|uniref:exodeoxyribonuclease VII large subunit n=1 Tax=Neisseria sp. Ec49-e6-T10 TaxID=3140744 RepID=UPI003EB8B1A1
MDDLFQAGAISVSALNAQARQLLENNFKNIWVSGEVSNLTRAASGHYYFALKDEMAQVRCALFKGYASKLSTPLTEGAQIELTGNISIYEARGEFQITVTEVRFSGLGRLFEAFEKLKAKLQAEGLFHSDRKKQLPVYAHKIGIVTSPAAAALKDVLSTLRRRMGKPNIILYPTPVQGALSEHSIAKAINIANERKEVDVLIVCRGGGSIEDLWAFNEEVVARAVAQSDLPIVSGVGHETDFTIADFVADVRAPTPTAAAELVSFDMGQLMQYLSQQQNHLQQSMWRLYANASQKLDWLSKNLIHPRQQLKQQKQQLLQYQQKLQLFLNALLQSKAHQLSLQKERLPHPNNLLKEQQEKLSRQRMILNDAMQLSMFRAKQQLMQTEQLLEAVAPHNVLQRGFAIVQNKKKQVVNSASHVKAYEKLHIIFADSTLDVVAADQDAKQEELPF